MPSPSSSRRALSRRTTLLGTLALGTAACTPYSLGSDQSDPEQPTRTESPRTDPDVALAAAVLAAEQALLDRVDATTAAHPRLGPLLADARATHQAHVDLLADAAPDGPSPSPSRTAPATASPDPAPATEPVQVPPDAARAIRALARHEDDLSLADKRSAFAAESGAFARVLASMAAAAAQQSALLRSTQVPGRRR